MSIFFDKTLVKFPLLVISFYHALEGIKHSILITVFGFHSTCRHVPTCSQYTAAEIKKNGTITGLCRGFTRFLFCW